MVLDFICHVIRMHCAGVRMPEDGSWKSHGSCPWNIMGKHLGLQEPHASCLTGHGARWCLPAAHYDFLLPHAGIRAARLNVYAIPKQNLSA